MKYLLCFLMCLSSVTIHAQSQELKSSLAQVNQTLKNYSLGTDEYSPSEFNSDMAKYYKYKIIRFSFEFPNLIFSYTIVNLEGGWSSSIKDGVYSVSIPINSVIEYPTINNYWGSKSESYYSVSFKNEEGLTKKTNGKSSIITSFSILGDSKLTTEKLAKELNTLWNLLKTENFRGKLGVNNSTGTRNTKRTGTKTCVKSKKIIKKYGKYGY